MMKSSSQNLEEPENSSTDSESTQVRISTPKTTMPSVVSISDSTIFKYCLGSLADRSLLLKEIASSASDQQLSEFANQLSIFSGCDHHRHQVKLAKRLIKEGTNVWNMFSNNGCIHWENMVVGIEEQFKRIACCNARALTLKDREVLRRIAGCEDYVAQENFEKIWCWLYPVAFMISRDLVKALWCPTSPKWIEGFITKEEAEQSLQGPRGLQEPGTFVLRFPTSRSWPHQDAGNLVVTYVGRDYTLHHRLLSIDYCCSNGGGRNANGKSLQEMLLAEPGLSRLGRVRRSA